MAMLRMQPDLERVASISRKNAGRIRWTEPDAQEGGCWGGNVMKGQDGILFKMRAQHYRKLLNGHLRECGKDHASSKRVIEWLRAGAKKTPSDAFSAGPERQIAYHVLYLVRKLGLQEPQA